MARYIEENEIYKLVEPRGTAHIHCSQIDELPRADVVPSSEVERLKHILNCYALQYGTVTDKQKVIDQAKQDLAREILMAFSPFRALSPDFCKVYYEIENKYMGDKLNG